MPLWHVLPIDSTSDHWRASTYKGEVIVRATSDAEARSTATATFSRAYARVPGGIPLFSPWNQPAVVECQRVEGFPSDDHGPTAVIYPLPGRDETRGTSTGHQGQWTKRNMSSHEENGMRIFVGNLPRSTTEEDLAQRFHPYGAIASVHILTDRDTGRSRGFGFVEMPDASEAQAAIAGLNGTSLEGRPLTVSEAHPREGEERPRRPRW
jgi:hypothetical protein